MSKSSKSKRAKRQLAEARQEVRAARERWRAAEDESRATRGELRAAQARYRAVAQEAEEAALPQDERDFRALFGPWTWHHGEDLWERYG